MIYKLIKWFKRNVCEECDYYCPKNNICQSKKCATCGCHPYVNWFDRHFCEPHKAESEANDIGEQMEFPETFERFAKMYGFKDDKEVYTNSLDLIPIFRVEQWLEHIDKLRRIGEDTAYECGKHAKSEVNDICRKE